MQISGIGTEHNNSSHNVTNCLHDHSVSKKEGGAARSASLDTVSLSNQNTATQPEAQFSLSAWLDKTLNGGKELLQRIWGSDQTTISNGTEGQSLEAQVLTALDDDGVAVGVGVDVNGQPNYSAQSGHFSHTLNTPQVAAAATAVQVEQSRTVEQNPYFTAIADNGRAQETLWQKMKVKFKDAAGKLAGHLPGRFAEFQSKSSFQAKKEQPREDLRKRSKYRQDTLEIDCVLTDDSYLQDSYNKKGEYSTLAGDMRGNISTRK